MTRAPACQRPPTRQRRRECGPWSRHAGSISSRCDWTQGGASDVLGSGALLLCCLAADAQQALWPNSPIWASAQKLPSSPLIFPGRPCSSSASAPCPEDAHTGGHEWARNVRTRTCTRTRTQASRARANSVPPARRGEGAPCRVSKSLFSSPPGRFAFALVLVGMAGHASLDDGAACARSALGRTFSRALAPVRHPTLPQGGGGQRARGLGAGHRCGQYGKLKGKRGHKHKRKRRGTGGIAALTSSKVPRAGSRTLAGREGRADNWAAAGPTCTRRRRSASTVVRAERT